MSVKAKWRETELFYAVINNADYRGRVVQATAIYIVRGMCRRTHTHTLTLYLNAK